MVVAIVVEEAHHLESGCHSRIGYNQSVPTTAIDHPSPR